MGRKAALTQILLDIKDVLLPKVIAKLIVLYDTPEITIKRDACDITIKSNNLIITINPLTAKINILINKSCGTYFSFWEVKLPKKGEIFEHADQIIIIFYGLLMIREFDQIIAYRSM